jgi:hypothetical protein
VPSPGPNPGPPPNTCSYSIDPHDGKGFGPDGGTGSVNVTTGPNCAWSASSNANWLFVGPAGGVGNGSVGYGVAPNNSEFDRAGTLTIAGQTFTVKQKGSKHDD